MILRRITIGHLWVLLPIIGITVRGASDITDNSFLWHIRAGTLQLEAGEVLRADPFSFTFGGEPWRTQSWLADLGYGWAEGVFGGVQWVPLMTGLVGAATFGLMALVLARLRRGKAVTAVVLALLMWLGYAALVPRPVVFSYLLLAATLVVLQDVARLGWTLPLLLWAWAAIHGSFPLGLALMLLEAVRAKRFRLLLPHMAASVVAVSLTAHGVAVWETLWKFATAGAGLDEIQEWARPVLWGRANWPLLVLLGLIAFGLAARRIPLRDLWLLAPFALFALSAQRSVFPGAMVLAVGAAAALPEGALGRRSRGDVVPAIAAIVLSVGAILVLLRPVSLDTERFPVTSATELAPGRVFHDDAVGGYLIYSLGPDRAVFIDDRAELYGGLLSTMVDALDGEGWEALFARHGVEQALLRHRHELAGILSDRGWSAVHQDEEFVLLLAPDA